MNLNQALISVLVLSKLTESTARSDLNLVVSPSLVSAIGGVSCELLSRTEITSLIGNVDKLYSFNIDLTNPHLLKKSPYFYLMDIQRYQFTSNEIEFLNKTKKMAFVWENFHRPISLEILGSAESTWQGIMFVFCEIPMGSEVPSNCSAPGKNPKSPPFMTTVNVRQVEKFATIHVLPVHQPKEIGRNESASTVCFSFDQFNVTQIRLALTQPALEYFPDGKELHCITPLNYPSNIRLNFDYDGPLGKFNQSMVIELNPKLVIRHQLFMLLRNVRSLEDLTRFVQVELENGNASLVNRRTFDLPNSPTGVWFYYQKLFFGQSNLNTTDRTEMVMFDSEQEFSEKTHMFAAESCNDHYRQKDGLFSVATNKQRTEMLRLLQSDFGCLRRSIWSSWEMVSAWTCYHCPLLITHGTQVEEPPPQAIFDLQKR